MVGAALAQGDVNHIAGHVHHLAALLDPRRTVLTVHDIGHLTSIRRSARRLYRFFCYDLPSKRVAAFLPVSDFTRQHLLREFRLQPSWCR